MSLALTEICLDKPRASVHVSLQQYRTAGGNESVRSIRGNDNDTAGFHFRVSSPIAIEKSHFALIIAARWALETRDFARNVGYQETQPVVL